VLARQAEHVEAAGVLDQLRRPVAGDEHGVEPLERGDPHRLGRAHGEADAVDPGRGVLDEVDARVARVGRLGQRADVAEHLAERVRVEREHLRRRLEALRQRAHVVVRDGAHRAQRLGDDEVRLGAAHAVLVELVDGPALLGQLAHGAVDRRRRQARPDHVARDLGQVARRRRVVALVGDRGHLVAEAEREQRLGGGRDERDDAHVRLRI
jgi:hypothetical protein